MSLVEALEKKHLLQTYGRYPLVLERGQGCWLFDNQGKRYLDLLAGIGVNMLGHGHPRLMRVLAQQSRRAMHVSNLYYHPYQGKLAQRLAKISGLDRAFICNSGTEAWEGALKLARAWARRVSPEKYRFLSLDNSFHGRSMGSVSTTGQEKYRAPFEPLVPGVEFARFNDLAELAARVNRNTAAILLEVIQGEGGINMVSAEYLRAARRLADQHGALLILDEIQSGLGRTGRWFAYQHYDVLPDIVTVAKPLAGGFPLGAFMASDRVAEAFTPGMHGTTFGGGPLGCRLALEFLDIVAQERLMARAVRIGKRFKAKLEQLKAKHRVIREVRGIGLMLAADLKVPARPYVDLGHHYGILMNATHDTVLRFLPPFILEEKHVDQAAAILDRIFSELPA
jgi:acetylornithine aminotransferase/acetylornithine/N-succinyldiaminopimelate aminotransferase